MELGWHNKPLKFVPAAKKNAAYTGLANAHRLAGRWAAKMNGCDV